MEKLKGFIAEFRQEIILFAGLTIMMFWGINSFPFLDPDSYQWLEKSFEIFTKNNWLTHSMWFGKPPLIIWLTAASMKVFGATIFGMKFANLVISLLTVLMVYLLTTEMFNRKIALWTAVIFSVSPNYLFLRFSHKMDVAVALFMVSAFYFFYLFKKNGRAVNIYLFWASCFAGFMCKSIYAFYPVILIPLLLFLSKDSEGLKKIRASLKHHIAAVAIMTTAVLPWFIAQYMTHGVKFLECQYIENLGRLLFKGGEMGNRDNAIITFLPWSIFFVPASIAAWKKAKSDFNFRLIVWWFIPPLIAFSLSGDIKTIRYLMFALPAFCMALACYFEVMEPTKKLKGWFVGSSAFLFILAIAAIIMTGNSPDAFTANMVPLLGPFLIIFFGGMLAASVIFLKKGKDFMVPMAATTAISIVVLTWAAFFYLPGLYPNMGLCRQISDRVAGDAKIKVVDMKFRDYAYMCDRVMLVDPADKKAIVAGD
jgi:4-amino-4-deoxy-L-arabinose transferase-like glycosyltransferase